VPSFDHEFLVDLFRRDAKLALELLRACAGIVVEHARVATGSIDLSQVAPTSYYADAVVVLHDRADQAVTGIIVEVQRSVEDRKRWSWPAYVANLRAQLSCAAILLVVAPDPQVAAWARRSIDLGHPGFQLTPIVVGFDDVPSLRDRAAALDLPELAVLSVLAHPEQEIAEIAIEAIAPLPADRARLYLDVIMMAVPAEVRRELEARMQHYEYRSEFARKYYGQGITEGLEKGRVEGQQEGLRTAVIALARTKLAVLSDADIAAIEAVTDRSILTELVAALGRARSSSRARAAIERALVSTSSEPRRCRRCR
jgi:hypothetical protein